MDFERLLKSIGYTIGHALKLSLTKATRKEFSNLKEDTAIVIENSPQDLFFVNPYVLFLLDNKKHTIKDYSKTLIDEFDFGDKVRIWYRHIFKSTYDYDPPNWSKKRILKRKHIGHKLLSVERIL